MSFTRLWPTRLRARKSGLLISSSENLTSSAVNDVPSCHFTALRSLIFQVRPSAESPPFSIVGTELAIGIDEPERREHLPPDALIDFDARHQGMKDRRLLRQRRDHLPARLVRRIGRAFGLRKC